jgi:hypothetical protein
MKKAVVITGTEVKGCTFYIKEAFLQELAGVYEVTEFILPKDMPQCFQNTPRFYLKASVHRTAERKTDT